MNRSQKDGEGPWRLEGADWQEPRESSEVPGEERPFDMDTLMKVMSLEAFCRLVICRGDWPQMGKVVEGNLYLLDPITDVHIEEMLRWGRSGPGNTLPPEGDTMVRAIMALLRCCRSVGIAAAFSMAEADFPALVTQYK